MKQHVLLLCLAIAFLLSSQAYSQDSVANWFPVHLGDKWIYEHETRDAGVNGNLPPLEIHRWQTEETVTGSSKIPQGTLVEIQVRIIQGSLPTGWRSYPHRAYLIRDNCLYLPEYGEIALDSSGHQLSADFIEGLNHWASPDFCFSFVLHKKWGAPDGLPDWNVTRPGDAKDWEVVGLRPHDPLSPDKKQTFHISSISAYPGSGMTVDIWFEKGIGVIREDEIHHGTIGEEKTRLVRFQPASRKPTA
ncbi:MAG: hypothetical protein ABSA57_02070 [Candidatus Acidiferrales bacterium]|jgi:hypothetical protein